MKKFEHCTELNTYTFTHSYSREGGSARVYKCENIQNELLALKVMKRDNSDEITRFQREIETQKEMSHKNICKIIDSGINEKGFLFYVMPYYNQNLRNRIKDLSNENKINAFLQICDGVLEIHKNRKVHRDLKPENILFDDDNNLYLIADFGIFHDMDISITKKSDRLANFDYHAPEQRTKNNEKIGSYTDIYALGLILNELFTGVIPKGRNFAKVGDGSPMYDFINDIIDTMLDYDVQKRESNLQNIINKVIKGFELMKLYNEDIASRIGVSLDDIQIIDDIYIANKLANEKTDWTIINTNYHPEYSFSANRNIIDSHTLINIHRKLELCFSGEDVDTQIKSEVYNIDLKIPIQKKLYKEFEEYIYKLKSYVNFDGYKKECLKYLLCIRYYHAREIFSRLDISKKEKESNFLDAPILWVTSHLLNIGHEMKEIFGEKIDLSRYLEYNGKTNVKLSDSNLIKQTYDISGIQKLLNELIRVVGNVTFTRISYYKYELIMSVSSFKKFKLLCKKIINIDPGSLLSADIQDILNKSFHVNKIVYIEASGFDFDATIRKVVYYHLDRDESNPIN